MPRLSEPQNAASSRPFDPAFADLLLARLQPGRAPAVPCPPGQPDAADFVADFEEAADKDRPREPLIAAATNPGSPFHPGGF